MSNIERIASLLALAERTDNEAEADAYLAKAQSLATMHSVDLALAQAKIAHREKRETPVNRQITVGERGKHANKHMVSLFLAIAGQNDVKVDIAHNSTYVVAYGLESDIGVTEALWGSLAHQMVQAANQHLKDGEWRGTTYRKAQQGWWGVEYVEKPVTGKIARASFYKGFISRIGDRLAAARREAMQEAEKRHEHAAALAPVATEAERQANEASSEPSVALVMKAKSDEIHSYYKKASNARGSWGGYRGAASGSSSSAVAGRTAANSARLSSAKPVGGVSGSLSN